MIGVDDMSFLGRVTVGLFHPLVFLSLTFMKNHTDSIASQGSTNGTWRRLSCALEPSQPCVAWCLKIVPKYVHCDIYIYNIDIDIEHIYIYMYIYVYIYI